MKMYSGDNGDYKVSNRKSYEYAFSDRHSNSITNPMFLVIKGANPSTQYLLGTYASVSGTFPLI